MIVIDANVFMYAAGREHPHRRASIAFLGTVARGDVEAVTNAEVLQELLHRYRRLVPWKDAAAVYDHARRIVSEVLPVTAADLDRARRLIERYPALATRDAVHAAVVLENGADALCSWDLDVGVVAELDVVTPAQALPGPAQPG